VEQRGQAAEPELKAAMASRTAVVAGALGIVGRALVNRLLASGGWDVVSLSRRQADLGAGVRHVQVNLLDAHDTHAKLRELDNATHVFYCAYAPGASAAQEVAPNLAMVVNLVEALEKSAPRLAHVQLIHGTKWYGNHLGPFRTPAREGDPRHMPPNFYYDQQDWLEAQQRGKRWSWSTLRPHCICGFSVGSPMNHLMALSVYATLSRELGLPLRFPGHPQAFAALYQFTDARLLARAMEWAATTVACENQSFNMNNGEPERWMNIWADIARVFGMQAGDVQQISLVRTMADKGPLWAQMCAKYRLQPHSLDQLVSWNFADWAYSAPYDQVSSLAKARRAGWSEVLDATTMFRELVADLVEQQVIPAPA
jgi:nucleoside-diphosphate-sugar epimerase